MHGKPMSKVTHSLPFPLALVVFVVHLFDLIILGTSVYLLDCMHWFYQRRSLGPHEPTIKKKKHNNLPCSLKNEMLNIFKTRIKYDSKKSMHTPSISQISL